MAIIAEPREDNSPQRHRDTEEKTRQYESTEVAEATEKGLLYYEP
jgi:hypothetical protein